MRHEPIIANNTLHCKVRHRPDIKNLKTSRPMKYRHIMDIERTKDDMLESVREYIEE